MKCPKKILAIFPTLSTVALKLLSLPSSSASAERSFSKVKRILTDYRSSLSAEVVEGIMLL